MRNCSSPREPGVSVPRRPLGTRRSRESRRDRDEALGLSVPRAALSAREPGGLRCALLHSVFRLREKRLASAPGGSFFSIVQPTDFHGLVQLQLPESKAHREEARAEVLSIQALLSSIQTEGAAACHAAPAANGPALPPQHARRLSLQEQRRRELDARPALRAEARHINSIVAARLAHRSANAAHARVGHREQGASAGVFATRRPANAICDCRANRLSVAARTATND